MLHLSHFKNYFLECIGQAMYDPLNTHICMHAHVRARTHTRVFFKTIFLSNNKLKFFFSFFYLLVICLSY